MKIEVDASALRKLLIAVHQGGVEMREMMVLKNGMFDKENPIFVLTNEFNSWAGEQTKETKS